MRHQRQAKHLKALMKAINFEADMQRQRQQQQAQRVVPGSYGRQHKVRKAELIGHKMGTTELKCEELGRKCEELGKEIGHKSKEIDRKWEELVKEIDRKFEELGHKWKEIDRKLEKIELKSKRQLEEMEVTGAHQWAANTHAAPVC